MLIKYLLIIPIAGLTISCCSRKHNNSDLCIEQSNKAMEMYAEIGNKDVLDSVILLLDDAIQCDSLLYAAYANKASILYNHKQYCEAKKVFSQMLNLHPDLDGYTSALLSQCHHYCNDVEETETMAQKSLALAKKFYAQNANENSAINLLVVVTLIEGKSCADSLIENDTFFSSNPKLFNRCKQMIEFMTTGGSNPTITIKPNQD